jgi:hypothetical protein
MAVAAGSAKSLTLSQPFGFWRVGVKRAIRSRGFTNPMLGTACTNPLNHGFFLSRRFLWVLPKCTVHIKCFVISHDVITRPSQLMRHRFDGYHR